jgi:hypothetical protein
MNRIIGITSNTVPWEILRAAGHSPRLLEAEPGPTPIADRLMEDVFDHRIRVIFDRLCAGAWNDVQMVVIPRTSEQEHKLYLYLREASRAEYSGAVPELYLYNLLHTCTPESYDYGLERTRQMARDFKVSDAALCAAIVESNRTRETVREIQRKRSEGFLEGSAAIELIHGFYAGDRAAFTGRVSAQLEALHIPVALNRPRVLIKGTSTDDTALHLLVEQVGGYVVAEDDWRGSRAAGERDVRTDMDPVTAIFEKYFNDETSPRVQPSSARDAWYQGVIHRGEVDGVLFYVPFDDDVVGWDYPRQAKWLEARGVPFHVTRDSRETPHMATFLRSLARR